MSYNLDKFKRGLDELQIQLSEEQMQQFITYYELLVERNKVMNLTAITEFDEVIEKHFLDSLCLGKSITLSGNLKLLDLGTGAGFPGIPLKIAFPKLNIVLMDSLNKRINFLNEVIRTLGLTSITAVHGRAEEMAQKKEYREEFDLVVSRAVANLSSLSEYCIPFVKEGGAFVSYKSADSDEEITDAKHAIFLLGGKTDAIVKYQVPGSDIGRALVKINKVKHTPKAYPRKAGTPSKNPL